MPTEYTRNSIADNWPAMRQAARQLSDDLHVLYPTHGENYFAEIHGHVDRYVRQLAPATDAELQARLATLGELTLVAYRVRERIELGTVM